MGKINFKMHNIILQDNLIPLKKNKKTNNNPASLTSKNPIMIICESWYGH